VQPTFREDATIIGMNVLARRTEDVEEFMDRLEETGAFENVLPQTQDLTEEGLYRVVLNAIYTAVSDPAGTTPEPAAPGRGDSPAAPPPEGGRGQ
jgi:hypothetical protein